MKYVFQHVNASNKVQMLKDIYCTYLSIIGYLTCEIKQKNNNNPNKNKWNNNSCFNAFHKKVKYIL